MTVQVSNGLGGFFLVGARMHTITLEGNVKKENCLGLDVPSLTLGEVLKEPLFEVSSLTLGQALNVSHRLASKESVTSLAGASDDR
jgi:hypothetical protein